MRDEFKITYRGIEAPEQIVAAISIEDVIEALIWAEGVDSALDHKTIGEATTVDQVRGCGHSGPCDCPPENTPEDHETVPPEYDYFELGGILYRVKPGEQESEFYAKARGVWYPASIARAELKPYKLTAF